MSPAVPPLRGQATLVRQSLMKRTPSRPTGLCTFTQGVFRAAHNIHDPSYPSYETFMEVVYIFEPISKHAAWSLLEKDFACEFKRYLKTVAALHELSKPLHEKRRSRSQSKQVWTNITSLLDANAGYHLERWVAMMYKFHPLFVLIGCCALSTMTHGPYCEAWESLRIKMGIEQTYRVDLG